MEVRVGSYILLILFFLILGKEEARAQMYATNADTCQVKQRMAQPKTWGRVYQWITDDPQVPDREEVLMLIRYHYGNFAKLTRLLRRLNQGRAWAYLSEHIFPKIDKAREIENDLSIIKLSLPADSLPILKMEPVPVPATMGDTEKRDFKSKAVLAIKNNLLYDLALAPNLEIELPIDRWWSLNVEYKCPWWSDNKRGFCYQLLSAGVEARFWLGSRKRRKRLTGHFLGIYAEGGVYDFQFDEDKGYRGDYYAASGVTYGYSHQLAQCLALEFSVGIGYLETDYRKYTTYEGDLIWTSSGRYHFIGPTKAKVSLVWLIKGRRQ